MLAHHAARASASFRERGLHAAVVKGATFARRLYADPSLRTFTDVDLLIRAQDRAEASEVMENLDFELFTFEDRAGKDYFEDKWILKSQKNVMVEVHIDLVHSPKLRRAMSLTYDDLLDAGDGDVEAATALLLVAGAHGAIGHQFDRLQLLVDVARAATGSGGPIDVELLRLVAARCGLQVALVAALDLAGRTFDVPACRDLARQIDNSLLARAASLCLSPKLVVTAQSTNRVLGSWRRKTFRQLMGLGISPTQQLNSSTRQPSNRLVGH